MIRVVMVMGALSAMAVGACAADKGNDVTAEGLRASLDEALPAGAMPDRVIGDLDARGYAHSAYVKAERRIDAIRRDPDGSKTISRSLAMRFDFDADDRLRAIDVREVFTGP